MWVTMITAPSNASSASRNASTDSWSRWFVGSSSRRRFTGVARIFARSTRLRSPPESTEILFSAASPPNIMAPQRFRTCVRVREGFPCRTSSSIENPG